MSISFPLSRILIAPCALCVLIAISLFVPTQASVFQVNTSVAPESHHPIAPQDGSRVSINPPSLVWREDSSAESYMIELSQDKDFTPSKQLIQVKGIQLPFYNHNQVLPQGTWYWRYFVVRKSGERSAPGPVRSFTVQQDAEAFPVPSMDEVFALLPEHPRIFVTPKTLAAFQQKRETDGKEAWEALEVNAQRALKDSPRIPGRKVPLKQATIKHNEDSISPTWKERQPVRRQVFLQNSQGELFWLPRYTIRMLNATADSLNTLSLAWQISEEEEYLEHARKLMSAIASLRLDAHLSDDERAEHDTVVYAYETGLKAVALAYDRLYHQLSEEERAAALAHIEFHVQAAGNWLKKVNIHTAYQQSHPQQCMHSLLVTVLATAGDSLLIDHWVRYLVPQYMNRIAWTSEDGGYFEGQTYGHKFAMILEALAAIRSATGVDLFAKPEIRNSGEYWLYAMNLNYWFNHWGENYSLIWPHANPRDAYITALLAAMNNDPYVKWYSETILTNPQVSPFDYLSATPLRARPPIDVPQARLFALTGTVAAYNKLYDHSSERIFFRSSRWGAQSHAHADQNSVVIHSGGEILAADTGYYTYYGDDYHMKWSKATFAHNSMLVNQQPQKMGNAFYGSIDAFFHGSRLTYFVGDASRAYEQPLETFHRAVLYVRPATYIVYDELAASSPTTYSWLLNVFQQPKIDSTAKQMVIEQRDMRMQVDTLLPQSITYSASNDRPYPIWDGSRAWSRFTEAFPQPWHIRIENAKRSSKETFLTLIRTGNENTFPLNAPQTTIDTEDTVGLAYTHASEQAVVLFRRNLKSEKPLGNAAINANAQAVAVISEPEGELKHWMVASGTDLRVNGQTLFSSDSPLSLSGDLSSDSAAALFHIDGSSAKVQLRLQKEPRQIFISNSVNAEDARPLPFTWDEAHSNAVLNLANNTSATVWVDPAAPLASPLATGQLEVTDSAGTYTIELEAARDESGHIIYFAEIMPREIGTYTVRTMDAQTESNNVDTAEKNGTLLFIQDRWNPYSDSSRGVGTVSALIRDGSYLYFTTKSGAPNTFVAELDRPLPEGAIDNILFNGDFEMGIPGYPPRGWTLSFTRGKSMSWYHWTQEDARSGQSSLHYIRDKNAYQLTARPMRLLKDGDYHLRFYAKGNITNARLAINGSLYRSTSVSIQPSEDWKPYETKINLPAGYTRVALVTPDGPKGQELWLDDIEFGLVPNPNPQKE